MEMRKCLLSHVISAHMATASGFICIQTISWIRNAEFLYQYNKDEQRELIRYVTEKYKEALGEVPVHFRAGKYAANNDTLELLSEFGYKYDYSQFYGRDWCAIDPPITADSACRYGSFYEIPVTSFYALDTPLLSRVDKVDMEMSPRSFRRAVKKFNSLNDNQILTLFGHSFFFYKASLFRRYGQALI